MSTVAIVYCGRPKRLGDLARHPAGVPGDSTSSSELSRPVSGNSPRALTDARGACDEVQLVDKVVFKQPPDQGAAAVHLQLASRLGFQLPMAAVTSPERTVVIAQ